MAVAVAASILVLIPQSASAAADGGAVLPPVDDCAGAVAIVVGSDAAAQSDIYSAVTLAGVVDAADAERGACVVLAGGRSEPMPAEQQARLAEASGAGWVVGGPAAVPDEKVPTGFTRVWGPDRWATARAVGAQATRLRTGDSGAPTPAPSSGTGRPAGPGGAALPPVDDCAGAVAIVVGSDAAAQSDVYSAVTLAGVVDAADAERGACVVLAGGRSEPMPAAQRERLGKATAGGFVVGGIAAVPTAKVAGRDMTRLAGADRWATARLVGRRASGDTTAGTSTASESQDASDGTPASEAAFTQIAMSTTGNYQHGCALRTDRTAVCWGDNSFGQASVPTGRFRTVAVMEGLSCGVRLDNTVVCWGDLQEQWAKVLQSEHLSAVSMSVWRLCGVRGNGDIACWYLLRDYDSGESSVELRHSLPGPFAAVVQGLGTSLCGIRADGTIRCVDFARSTRGKTWISEEMQPRGKFASVTLNRKSACFLGDDGSVRCASFHDPFPIPSELQPSGTFRSVVAAYTGTHREFYCGIRSDSTVTCWEYLVNNRDTQGNLTNNWGPGYTRTWSMERFDDIAPGRFTSISLSDELGCGIRVDKTMACWWNLEYTPGHRVGRFEHSNWAAYDYSTSGTPDFSRLGRPSGMPVPPGKFTSVSVDGELACGNRLDGAIICMTLDIVGTQGNTSIGVMTAPSNSRVVQRWWSPRMESECVLRESYIVECVEREGYSFDLGPPSEQLKSMSGSSYGELRCGILVASEELYCWGRDLSDGALVPPSGRFRSLSLGGRWGCAISTRDTIACWGGYAGTDREYEVVKADSIPRGKFKAIATGTQNACAIRADDTVACWGDMLYGGHPKTGSSERLATPPSGRFRSVSAGTGYWCGVRLDGTVACWGGNFAGDAQPPPSGTFEMVQVGSALACGLRTDKTIACWGQWGVNDNTGRIYSDFKTWFYSGLNENERAESAQLFRNYTDFLRKSHQNVEQVIVMDRNEFCFRYTDGSYACHWPLAIVNAPGSRRIFDGVRTRLFY